MKSRIVFAVLLVAGLAGGCRTTPPPAEPDAWKGVPVGAIATLNTPLAIRARRDVLEQPGATDAEEATLNALALLCRQDRDGSWDHDIHRTARALWDLADLAVPGRYPGVQRAAEWIGNLGRNPLSLQVHNEAWGDRWLALRALLRLGYEEHPTVRRAVEHLIETADEWFGSGVPGQTEAILLVLGADPKLRGDARIDAILGRLEAAQREDGTWEGIPGFWETIEALAALAGSDRAKAIFEKALPRVLETQGPDGTWDSGTRDRMQDTFAALWALKAFGKLEDLEGGAGPSPRSISLEIRLVADAEAADAAVLQDAEGHAVRTAPEPLLTSARIARASFTRSAEDADEANLYLELDGEGRGILEAISEKEQGKRLALVVEGRVAGVVPVPAAPDKGLHIEGIPFETGQAVGEAFAGAIAP